MAAFTVLNNDRPCLAMGGSWLFARADMRKAITTVRPHESSHAAHPGDDVQRELWKLLDSLALCRRHYDLTANSLSVLRALISFLPKSTPVDGALVVWPSNRVLCERADGMDERTLRRHIDRLVAAGLIHRRPSSNGKRFALRYRASIVAAFGFDLAPLRDSAENIAAAAQTVRSQTERSAALRVEILNLLHALNRSTGQLTGEEEAKIRRILRRRADPQILSELRDKLLAMQPVAALHTEEMTVCDRQIDRHQQKTEKDSYDSVCRQADEAAKPFEIEEAQKAVDRQAEADITLADCLNATTESQAFAQEPVRSWPDLMRLADTLAPMIGVERELAEHARRAMGPLQAAISILCVIQRNRHIRQPAAYLRRLATLAETGQYSLKSMVRSSMRERFASANQASA